MSNRQTCGIDVPPINLLKMFIDFDETEIDDGVFRHRLREAIFEQHKIVRFQFRVCLIMNNCFMVFSSLLNINSMSIVYL